MRGPQIVVYHFSLTILTALFLPAALVACDHTGSPAPSPPASLRAVPANRQVKRVFIVNHPGADEFVFSPRTLRVRVGSKVIWVNRSVQPHTVTAKGEPPAFNSGVIKLIKPTHQFSFVFHHVGRYAYFCLLHPYMTGTIIVRA
jgi:plastocyanin